MPKEQCPTCGKNIGSLNLTVNKPDGSIGCGKCTTMKERMNYAISEVKQSKTAINSDGMYIGSKVSNNHIEKIQNELLHDDEILLAIAGRRVKEISKKKYFRIKKSNFNHYCSKC